MFFLAKRFVCAQIMRISHMRISMPIVCCAGAWSLKNADPDQHMLRENTMQLPMPQADWT